MVVVHLGLVFWHQTSAQLGITVICWYAVITLVLSDWRRFDLSSLPAEKFLGFLLLLFALSSVFWISDARESFLFVYPLLGATGLGLLASGIRGMRRCWRELVILFCLGIPRGFISDWVDLSGVTARVAGFGLWHGGWELRLAGTTIIMPGGSVTVDKGCDGTGVISYLICVGVVFVFLFPVRGAKRGVALALAPVLAFFTNVLRIMALALMEAAGRHEAFEYWHNGSGSLLWTMLPVLLFGLFGLILLPGKTRMAEEPGHTRLPLGGNTRTKENLPGTEH